MTDKLKNNLYKKRNPVEQVCIEKLISSIKTDVSGKWVSTDELKELIDKVVGICIVAAVNAPINTASKVLTTHDLGIAEYVTEQVIDSIKISFGRS